MNKSETISRRQFSDNKQSYFSKHSTWANNHNGWSKMKKKNRKLLKKKIRRETWKEANDELNNFYI